MADLVIKIRIPEDKIPKFRERFLAACPKPIPPAGEPISDLEWAELWGKNQYRNACHQGKKKLIAQQTDEDDIFT